MKVASYFRLQVLLAGAMLLLSPQAAPADSTAAHKNLTGTYLSHAGKKDPSMGLSLGEDGTATMTEDAGKGANTFFGHWVDSGADVTVTFDAVEGKPAKPAMVFQPIRDGLQAVTWNHADWGTATPPPMKKGVKVKQMYWFTTVR